MKCLFVSNQFPFPPRDGVTLPFSNYVRRFHESGDVVDMLVLERPSSAHSPSCHDGNFRHVHSVRIESQPLLRRLGAQWIGRHPFFAGWTVAEPLPTAISQECYDLVMTTPRAVMKVVDDLKAQGQLQARVHVAAVNDIATLAKQQLGRAARSQQRGWKGLLRSLRFRFQAIGMRAAELNLLRNCCDLFLVQSQAESNWVQQYGGAALEAKSIQLSNGVDDVFFDLPMERTTPTVTFVGRIEGEYVQRVEWLIDRVWQPVQAADPQARFSISGRCVDAELLSKMERHQILHRDFVEDPAGLFADQAVLLAPIFKGYGLINKVVQSMAAGTLVIGDRTAFNAIPGFEPGLHGLVADNPAEFVSALRRSLSSPDRLLEIRMAARELVQKHFRWDIRFQTLRDKIEAFTSGNLE